MDGLLEILALSIGWCAIRAENEYNVSSLLCYIMFLMIDSMWALVKVCLFYTGVSGAPGGVKDGSWQYYTYQVSICGGLAYYLVGGWIAWKLYHALKNVFDPLADQQFGQGGAPAGAGAGYAGAGYGGYGSGASGGYQQVPAQAAMPAPGPARSSAFSGKGYKLGGNSSSSTPAPASSSAQQRAAGGRTAGGRATGGRSAGGRGIPAAALARLEGKARGRSSPDNV